MYLWGIRYVPWELLEQCTVRTASCIFVQRLFVYNLRNKMCLEFMSTFEWLNMSRYVYKFGNIARDYIKFPFQFTYIFPINIYLWTRVPCYDRATGLYSNNNGHHCCKAVGGEEAYSYYKYSNVSIYCNQGNYYYPCSSNPKPLFPIRIAPTIALVADKCPY